MNRVFKRLEKGGHCNLSPEKKINFTFEGKSYTALEGDTIEAAFFANNLFHPGYTQNGHLLSCASGLYANITNVHEKDQQYSIAMRDFKISEGLKLKKTNKPYLKDRIRLLKKMFSSPQMIPENIKPIRAHDITQAYIKTSPCLDACNMVKNMAFDSEKSYLHTDIVFSQYNIFSLQAALLCANADMKIILCHTENDNPWQIFYDKNLSEYASELYQSVHNHQNIKIINIDEITLHKQPNKTHLIAFKRAYQYGCEKIHKQQSAQIFVINARKIILSPTPKEAGFLFSGHHMQAIMGCREYISLYKNFGLQPQKTVTLYVSNDMAYDVLSLPHINPNVVNAIIDTRSKISPIMAKAQKTGYKLYSGHVITKTSGKNKIEAVSFQPISTTGDAHIKTVETHLLLQSSGYNLDLSVFNSIPSALTAEYAENKNLILNIDVKQKIGDNVDVLGYNLCLNTAETSKSDPLINKISKILVSLNIDNDINTQLPSHYVNILDHLKWSCPQQYTPHTLCARDQLYFPQGILYNDFIQLIYQHEYPSDIFDIINQDHYFCENLWAVQIILFEMKCIYNFTAQQMSDFYLDIYKRLIKYTFSNPTNILKKISISGQKKTEISFDGHIETANTLDYALSLNEAQHNFHNITQNVGIRCFNNRDIIDISGFDAIAFLEKFCKHENIQQDLNNIAVGGHAFSQYKHFSILFMRTGMHNYSIITPETLDFDTRIQCFYKTYPNSKVIANDISHSWSYMQLVGKKAQAIFESLIQVSLSGTNKVIPQAWIGNIQIRFAFYQRYGIPHIDFLVESDAAVALYAQLTHPETYNISSFSEKIYNIIALEAGEIFEKSTECQSMKALYNTSYTTQALIVPLPKYDALMTTIEGGSVYSEKMRGLNDPPKGIVSSSKIFSPHHNQYVIPTLLEGDFSQWENKIVSVISKDKKQQIQAKIISDKNTHIQEVA